MDKLDLVFLPFVYVLRMTQPLFLLAGSWLSHFYNYWFHTSCDNVALHADILVLSAFLACQVASFSLQVPTICFLATLLLGHTYQS